MSTFDIIRAWKDEDYRLSLSDAQRSMLPDSPVGPIELSDADMGMLAGGTGRKDDCKEKHTGFPGSCGNPYAPGCKKKHCPPKPC